VKEKKPKRLDHITICQTKAQLYFKWASYKQVVHYILAPTTWCLVLSKVWTGWAPTEATVFSWQVLFARISSKSNLIAKGFLSQVVHPFVFYVGIVWNRRTIFFFFVLSLWQFGLRGIDGLELSKSSPVIFGSSWIAFYHPLIEARKLRRVSFWFGMRWFVFFNLAY
jgi:hypothetical protein